MLGRIVEYVEWNNANVIVHYPLEGKSGASSRGNSSSNSVY